MKMFFNVKTLKVAVALCLCMFVLAACSSNTEDANVETQSAEVMEEAMTEVASDAEANANEVTAEVTTEAEADGVTRIENNQTEAASAEDGTNEKLVFTANGTSFIPTDEASPVIEALGEPDSFYEAPSCVFAGNDQVYAYPGYEVNTAAYNDKDVIVGIFLTDNQASTPENITIGSTVEEAIAVYGEPDEDDGIGQYTWHFDNYDLIIVSIEDEITSLSYLGQFGQ